MEPVSALDFRRLGGALLDLLLPPRCLRCGEAVSEQGALCAECWHKISFIGTACCDCCGLPFDLDLGQDTLCALCARDKPPFSRARSAMRYDEESRPLVLAFKHGDKLQLAPALGRFMRRAGASLLAETDVIVPVPLHWTRLFARRYNQAAVLAHAVGKASGIPVGADWLQRRRATPSQGRQSRTERRRNVAGAFAVKHGRKVENLRVLLIDDVLTTGATVAECAMVLLKAGAMRVDVLTLARTSRPEN
ncbi:MAG TPA: ComF family protein [Stellaceae bacterium]|jgi:ComF family protein|nr:ComF family protein [Stellaceae bacterium]